MERDRDNSSGLLELGTASADTLGTEIVGHPEQSGFYALGLSDE
jgi:hypothetical protein